MQWGTHRSFFSSIEGTNPAFMGQLGFRFLLLISTCFYFTLLLFLRSSCFVSALSSFGGTYQILKSFFHSADWTLFPNHWALWGFSLGFQRGRGAFPGTFAVGARRSRSLGAGARAWAGGSVVKTMERRRVFGFIGRI